jgi:hypothetical protein
MSDVVEMRLCEQERVFLKPDTLYRFTVDPQCPACATAASNAQQVATHSPAVGEPLPPPLAGGGGETEGNWDEIIAEREDPSVGESATAASGEAEPTYPCADCGKLRTKAEGGTTFTVCDECWDKHYPPRSAPAPAQRTNCRVHEHNGFWKCDTHNVVWGWAADPPGTCPSQRGATGEAHTVWLCAKCGHGGPEHSLEGHPAFKCIADMRLTPAAYLRPTGEAEGLRFGKEQDRGRRWQCTCGAINPRDEDWCEGVGGKHPRVYRPLSARDRALAALSPAPAPASPTEGGRDWTEDFSHENGRYLNRCTICGAEFQGHKRRVTCRLCATPAPAVESERVEDAEWLAGWLEDRIDLDRYAAKIRGQDPDAVERYLRQSAAALRSEAKWRERVGDVGAENDALRAENATLRERAEQLEQRIYEMVAQQDDEAGRLSRLGEADALNRCANELEAALSPSEAGEGGGDG